MRSSRRLTSPERWELGLFLAMLFVGSLCLTAILNLTSLPRLFATSEDSPVAQTREITGAPTVAAETEQLPTPESPTFTPPAPVEQPPAVTPAPPKSTRKIASAPEIKTYKGQKYRYVRTLRLRVTAYAPDPRCCWPYPGTTTATGLSVKTNRGNLVAADPRVIPMHYLVSVPGYSNGNAVPVLDKGGAIKGHRLDVLLPNFDTAKNWGSRLLDVKVYEPIKD